MTGKWNIFHDWPCSYGVAISQIPRSIPRLDSKALHFTPLQCFVGDQYKKPNVSSVSCKRLPKEVQAEFVLQPSPATPTQTDRPMGWRRRGITWLVQSCHLPAINNKCSKGAVTAHAPMQLRQFLFNTSTITTWTDPKKGNLPVPYAFIQMTTTSYLTIIVQWHLLPFQHRHSIEIF